MNETDYNKLLYEKMKAEQDKFREWLLTQEPSEILNHTYEYTMREDIVMCMEELELSQKQAKALYKSPCPLSDVYEEFKDREVEHMWRIVGGIRDVLLCWTMKTPSFFYDNFYDKPNKVMTSYVRLCTLMKTVWINKVRKREVKSGYKILSLEIPTMKPLDK